MTPRYSVGMLGLYTEDIDRQTDAEDQFADLLEQAFLAGIINGEAQALAYLGLRSNHQDYDH